ncbi:MAG: DUF5723 family protein, partial [Bacteroidota bacterium]
VLKLQVSLGGLAYTHQNDLLGADNLVESGMLRLRPQALGDRQGDPYAIGQDGYHVFSQQTLMGPSVFFSLPKGWGIGLSTRLRSFHEVANLPTDIFGKITATADTLPGNQRQEGNNLGMKSLLMGEIGFSVGGILLENSTHSLKFGVRYKLLLGNNGLYFNANNYEYEFGGFTGNLRLYEIDAIYAHSERYYDSDGSWNTDFGLSRGWGGDFGLVYEFRPQAVRHSTGLWDEARLREDEVSYRFKLGLAVLDAGRLQFQRSDMSEDFSRNQVIPVVVDSLFPREVSEIDSFIVIAANQDGGSNTFQMALPRYVSLQLDYRFAQRLYLGAVAMIPSNRGTITGNPVGFQTPSRFVLSPRFETKRVMLGVPFSLMRGPHGSRAQMGLGARLGPLTFYSNNLFSSFVNQQGLNSINAMMSVQFNLVKPKP